VSGTPVEEQSVFEGFAGPGGMSEGMRLAGIPSALTVGWDNSKDACETAEKHGHRRIHANILDLDPYDAVQMFGRPHGYHGSSPCPGMSTAGKGLGRLDLPLLESSAQRIGEGGDARLILREVQSKQHDENSVLSLVPLWWIIATQPEWFTMEQVPTVLPLWEVYAEVMRRAGYSVVAGNIQAEQYGVPQTRKRAVVIGSRVRHIPGLPTPTHSRFHTRTPAKLDVGVEKWVSMAEAVGWGMVQRPYPTVAAGTKSGGADPQMLGGSGARLIVARERENGEGHWIERTWHPKHGPVHMLGSGLANQQGQRARPLEEPSHTIVGKGTATWRFDEEERGRLLVGFPRKYDRGDAVIIDGETYRARDLRPADEPSFAVTEKARSWEVFENIEHPALRNNTSGRAGVRDIDEPAPTMYFGERANKMTWEESQRAAREWRERFGDLEPTHMGDVYNSKGTIRPVGDPAMTITASMDNSNFKFIDPERVSDEVRARLNNQSGSLFDTEWPAYRPAQVVAGRDLNTAPGANGNRFNGSKKSRNDGVRVTVEEAAAFQSMPEWYHFVGTKTSQFQQVGNLVPPLMGEAMVRRATGQRPGLWVRQEREEEQ
jgi:DNA (cytosine-5)-methyltransferase 1